MAISSLTELNQQLANIEQRFQIPIKYVSKEDLVALTTFLRDTTTFLYYNYEKASVIGENIKKIRTVADNVIDINTIANQINELTAIYGNINEISGVYSIVDKIVRLYQSIESIDILYPNIGNLDTLYNNLDGFLAIYANLTEILQADTNAQIATAKAAEASYHSDTAANRVQEKFDSIIHITGVKSQDVLLHNGTTFENIPKEQLSDGGNF